MRATASGRRAAIDADSQEKRLGSAISVGEATRVTFSEQQMDGEAGRWQEIQRLIAEGKLVARDDGWFDINCLDFIEARMLSTRTESTLRFTPGKKSRFQLRLKRREAGKNPSPCAESTVRRG
jgi:hypothetical protein